MRTIKSLSSSIIILLLALAFFGSAAAWLGFTSLCLYNDDLPLCRHPAGGWVVVIGVVALVIGWAALLLRERLRRRLTRGMYARVAGVRRGELDWAGWMRSAVNFAIEGEWADSREDQRHPLDLPDNYGWQVPLEDGSAVNVYVDELWNVLNEAWKFQQNPENRQKGATSQRVLDPKIGRPKTLAVNYLLDVAGGLRRNRATANSTRRITASPWSVMQNLMDAWPPGEIG